MKHALPIWSLMITSALLLAGCSGDGNTRTGQRVVLDAEEVHEGWLFASGDDVLILGTVEGDVYVAGGKVEIDGTVNGDLLVAGGTVTINGAVSDDVRAAGGNIECSGNVGKNITAAGGNIRLLKTAVVDGGVLAAGGEVHVGGVVAKDVMAAGGQIQLEGVVEGNVRCTGEQVTTLPGTLIHGDLHAIVREQANAVVTPGTVEGSVEITIEKKEQRVSILGYSVFHFWFKILWAISLIVTAIVVILLCPRFVGSCGQAIWQHPWWSLLWGFVAILAVPLVVLALCVTLIGIPLGLLLLMLYFWALYLSQIALGVVLGQRVFMPESKGRLMLATAAGTVLIQVLTFVPYLGTLVIIAGLLLGLGGIVEALRQRGGPSVKMSPPLA